MENESNMKGNQKNLKGNEGEVQGSLCMKPKRGKRQEDIRGKTHSALDCRQKRSQVLWTTPCASRRILVRPFARDCRARRSTELAFRQSWNTKLQVLETHHSDLSPMSYSLFTSLLFDIFVLDCLSISRKFDF